MKIIISNPSSEPIYQQMKAQIISGDLKEGDGLPFYDNIFNDNILNFIKGSQGRHPNWFNLPYNIESEMYELEVKVVLNRIGLYSHYNGGEIDFSTSDCPDYRLNTNILGVDEMSVEFSVIE